MIRKPFGAFEIELREVDSFCLDHSEIEAQYSKVYKDEESDYYQPKVHGIRVRLEGEEVGCAAICAVGGATGIHENSSVIVKDDLLVCCANKIISLSLPKLSLNWMQECDDFTCFQIFRNEVGIFVHGEDSLSRIAPDGGILWRVFFGDITITLEGDDTFILNSDSIDVMDWEYNRCKLNFDGEYI